MKLILNGGGDGKQVESARKLLNSLIDHNKKILYIPLAWFDPTFSGCLEFMTNELSDVNSAGSMCQLNVGKFFIYRIIL